MLVDDPFDACLDFTKLQEGGYTCSPEDSGNWSTGLVGQGRLIGSNMGVSAPTLISWLDRENSEAVTSKLMRNLPISTYKAIARARYWRSLACDDVPAPIAMMLFDFGWNVGVGRSARLLQTALGLAGDLVDGDLGAYTQRLLKMPNWPAILYNMDHSSIVRLQKLCQIAQDGIMGALTVSALSARPDLWPLAVTLKLAQEQLATYKSFSNFTAYGNGWTQRTTKRLAAAEALLATR